LLAAQHNLEIRRKARPPAIRTVALIWLVDFARTLEFAVLLEVHFAGLCHFRRASELYNARSNSAQLINVRSDALHALSSGSSAPFEPACKCWQIAAFWNVHEEMQAGTDPCDVGFQTIPSTDWNRSRIVASVESP